MATAAERNESIALTAPSPCPCGSAMPWHLFAVADACFTHYCACGRRWQWQGAGLAIRVRLSSAPECP